MNLVRRPIYRVPILTQSYRCSNPLLVSFKIKTINEMSIDNPYISDHLVRDFWATVLYFFAQKALPRNIAATRLLQRSCIICHTKFHAVRTVSLPPS